MSNFSLKTLLRAKSGDAPVVTSLMAALDGPLTIEDASGNLLMGASANGTSRVSVLCGGVPLGCVAGPPKSAEALASLLTRLAAREAERHALGAEVLHLYREIHLIDQLSEELTALLDVSAVAKSALTQARRLIAGSSGGILVREKAEDALRYCARFGDESALPAIDSDYVLSVLERGVSEIVNVGEMVNAFPIGPDGAASAFRSLLFAPLRAKQRTVGLIILMNDAGDPYSAADLKLLNTIALQTAAAIENSIICEEMVGAARYREQLTAIQKELDTARAIQHSLLPRTFPPFPGRTDFDIHAQMTAARAVGGDFFDFFLIDNHHLGVVIGDVSGKGTPSALYMAVTHTHVRSAALRGAAPEECMGEVNRLLLNDKSSSMFATCFYAILNTETGELRYSNAGHNPPYRIGVGGLIEPLEQTGGTPLGMFPWNQYGVGSIQLHPGDALFLYTDGVPEATNLAVEDFTDERLLEVLREVAEFPSREMIDVVNSRLMAFTAGAPQSDDITMVAVRR
jgi:sigma-B regulation protein RsbU (phosphoserine phosphatase)